MLANSLMHHYCTFFDHRYAGKGLALFWSLVEHCAPCKLYVLCLDNETKNILLSMDRSEIEVIGFDELCSWDPSLENAKSNRSLVEFYFTCKPSLCLYIFERWHNVTTLTYLDSDIFYCNAPDRIDREMEGFSVGLTRHRFSASLRVLNKVAKSGEFNAGWIMFRNDESGRACLEWWRTRCLEWCYDKVEDGRYADQGYLEWMPALFTGVKIIESEGVNAGPWNLCNYRISESNGHMYLNDTELICFHFHGMKNVTCGLWETGTSAFRYFLTSRTKGIIYKKYALELRRQNEYCKNFTVTTTDSQIRTYKSKADRFFVNTPGIYRFVKLLVALLGGLVFNSLLVLPEKH
ncbi:MAG: hypothetical protein NDI73_08890 [Desulfuromonadales bacterium]|nr:hypothetical protein [Desulfuromonadales bacterium]